MPPRPAIPRMTWPAEVEPPANSSIIWASYHSRRAGAKDPLAARPAFELRGVRGRRDLARARERALIGHFGDAIWLRVPKVRDRTVLAPCCIENCPSSSGLVIDVSR